MERAPTLTGQDRLATLPPLSCTASHNVRTLMSAAYQYQPPMFFCRGSKVGLLAMPCLGGPYARDQRGVVGVGDGGQRILHAAGISAIRDQRFQERRLEAARIGVQNIAGPQAINRDHQNRRGLRNCGHRQQGRWRKMLRAKMSSNTPARLKSDH